MGNRDGDNMTHHGGNTRLLSALNSCGVRFVVIGGLAVAWHCNGRDADDMDLLIDAAGDNPRRVATSLRELGIPAIDESLFAKRGLQVPLKHDLYADLLTPLVDGQSYEEIEASAVHGMINRIPVRFASVPALILMKRRAISAGGLVASKHLRDLELLGNHPA